MTYTYHVLVGVVGYVMHWRHLWASDKYIIKRAHMSCRLWSEKWVQAEL